MRKVRKEVLEQQISQLLKSNADSVLAEFRARVLEIKDLECAKEERDRLFEKLFFSFSLFYDMKQQGLSPADKQSLLLVFFEECGAIHQSNHNLLTPARVAKLRALVAEIKIENLTDYEFTNFAKNLDLIGFGQTSAFQSAELGLSFLRNGLERLRDVGYKGTNWTKSSIHFLLHCNNLGLILQPIPQEIQLLLAPIFDNIGRFIARHPDNLNFSESDIQASLDLLLYSQRILKLPINEEALAIIVKVAPQDKKIPSKPHREIFAKLAEFLENKEGAEGEWKHKAQASASSEEKIIFGGVVSIGMEESYFEIDGIAVKKGDIVVRNLVTNEVLLVIEIDGPPHFLSSQIKTGKTRARDEVARAMLGTDRFMVIDMKDFNLFRHLKQQASESDSKKSFEELEFLHRVQDVIQRELDKMAQSQATAAKEKTPKKVKPEEESVKPQAAAKTPPPQIPQKTIEEIKSDLQKELWILLEQSATTDYFLDKIEEILSDPIFATIPVEAIKDQASNLNPFDYALRKFNQAASREEKQQLEILLKLLWVNGFDNQNRGLIDGAITYPPELNRALGRTAVAAEVEKTANLNSLLINARRGSFRLIKVALERGGLPLELDEKTKANITELTEIAITQNKKGASYLLKFLQQQPWFAEIEEEVFIKALKDSNDDVAQFFLEQKKGKKSEFFRKIFHSNEHLLPKIYNFESYEISQKLDAEIAKDHELVKKMARAVAESPDPCHVRDTEHFYQIILTSVDEQSAEILLCKAISHLEKNTDKDSKKAEKLLARSAKLGSNDAKIILANIYDLSNRTAQAIPLFRELAAAGNGNAFFALASIEMDPQEKLRLLNEAALLKQPRALGMQAYHRFEKLKTPNLSPAEITKLASEALSLAQESANLGDVESLNNLGSFYMQGLAGKVDQGKKEKAVDFFRAAVSKKSASGAFNLACFHRDEDKPQALKFYNLCIEFCRPSEINIAAKARENIAKLEVELSAGDPRSSATAARVTSVVTSKKITPRQ